MNKNNIRFHNELTRMLVLVIVDITKHFFLTIHFCYFYHCFAGSIGLKGEEGAAGEVYSGGIGAKGEAGVPGRFGFDGRPGLKGERGDDGPFGEVMC